MIRITAILAVLILGISGASARSHQSQYAEGCNVLWPCIGAPALSYSAKEARADRATERANFGTAYTKADRRARWLASKKQSNVDVFSKGAYLNPVKAGKAMGRTVVGAVNGLVGPLAAKASEIMSACGSRSLGGVSHRNIAGTRILSLHATGQAIDLQGNPSCIYSHLANWPGGYSTDYARAPNAQHVHISYTHPGGREWGIRFAHRHYGHSRRYAKRHGGKHYAHRRHHHYASAAR